MIKTLKKRGNSQALVIDRALMEQLDITADTPLQIVVSGNSLIVTPVRTGIGTERVTEVMKQVRTRYGRALKNLAE